MFYVYILKSHPSPEGAEVDIAVRGRVSLGFGTFR